MILICLQQRLWRLTVSDICCCTPVRLQMRALMGLPCLFHTLQRLRGLPTASIEKICSPPSSMDSGENPASLSQGGRWSSSACNLTWCWQPL